jgi:hypothetical protein
VEARILIQRKSESCVYMFAMAVDANRVFNVRVLDFIQIFLVRSFLVKEIIIIVILQS